MKLLFDQNLSHSLVISLQDFYPESQHVRNIGLKEAPDETVWNYAAQHGFIIVTKDADYHQRSFLFGHPPKVVWLRCGNCSTAAIHILLQEHRDDLDAFASNPEGAFLVLE